MSYAPPTPPPEGLPDDIVETLNTHSPEVLRYIARYAEGLAEYREREARLAEQDDKEEIEERPEDLPDDVPSKATVILFSKPRFAFTIFGKPLGIPGDVPKHLW